MIKIYYYSDGFEISGHAGGMNGYDIVCAGVSAISQTALFAIEKLGGVKTYTTEGPGLLSVGYNETSEVIKTIEETMRIGLDEIAKQYPEKVRIIDLS